MKLLGYQESHPVGCQSYVSKIWKFGVIIWVFMMSISKVTHHFSCLLKEPCAIELVSVIFSSRLYLIEIVLYSFRMSVMVACMEKK